MTLTDPTRFRSRVHQLHCPSGTSGDGTIFIELRHVTVGTEVLALVEPVYALVDSKDSRSHGIVRFETAQVLRVGSRHWQRLWRDRIYCVLLPKVKAPRV